MYMILMEESRNKIDNICIYTVYIYISKKNLKINVIAKIIRRRTAFIILFSHLFQLLAKWYERSESSSNFRCKQSLVT
jgi:hypothetical protein